MYRHNIEIIDVNGDPKTQKDSYGHEIGYGFDNSYRVNIVDDDIHIIFPQSKIATARYTFSGLGIGLGFITVMGGGLEEPEIWAVPKMRPGNKIWISDGKDNTLLIQRN